MVSVIHTNIELTKWENLKKKQNKAGTLKDLGQSTLRTICVKNSNGDISQSNKDNSTSQNLIYSHQLFFQNIPDNKKYIVVFASLIQILALLGHEEDTRKIFHQKYI